MRNQCVVKSFFSSYGAEPQALPAIVCECVIVRDHPLHTLTVRTKECQLGGRAVNSKLSFQLKYEYYLFTAFPVYSAKPIVQMDESVFREAEVPLRL